MDISRKYIVITILLAFIVAVGIYIYHFFDYPISNRPDDWNSFASYFNSMMNPILAFVNILVLLGVGSAVHDLSKEKREHRMRLEKYNRYKKINEYKVVIDTNATAEDNLVKLGELLKQIEMLFEDFQKSDEKCEKDLYELVNRAGLSEEAVDLLHAVPYYENPFICRLWEEHNLGVNNTMLDVKTNYLQLKVNVYELLVKEKSNDSNLKNKYLSAQKELESFHKNSSISD